MKYFLLTILLLGLTGCTLLPNPPFGALTPIQQEIIDKPYLKLKVPKDKILFNQKITIPEIIIPERKEVASSTGETITIPAKTYPAVTFVKYDYISTTEVSIANITVDKKVIKEDLSKRTESSQHFKIKETATSTEWQGKFFSGQPFYKDAGKWFQTETATTTIDAWNEQNKLTVFENIKSFIKKFAGLPFAVMGTTTSYYSGAGDGSAKFPQINAAGEWARQRGASASDSVVRGNVLIGCNVDSDGLALGRGFFPVDTSSLPDSISISAATLYVYSSAAYGDKIYGLIQTTQADPTSLVVGDYDNLTLNSATEGATRKTFSTADAYGDFVMNSTGFTWINTTGYTLLGVRSSQDLDDIEVTNYQHNYVYFSDTAGTDKDPYLSVTYEIAAAPPSQESDIVTFGL